MKTEHQLQKIEQDYQLPSRPPASAEPSDPRQAVPDMAIRDWLRSLIGPSGRSLDCPDRSSQGTRTESVQSPVQSPIQSVIESMHLHGRSLLSRRGQHTVVLLVHTSSKFTLQKVVQCIQESMQLAGFSLTDLSDRRPNDLRFAVIHESDDRTRTIQVVLDDEGQSFRPPLNLDRLVYDPYQALWIDRNPSPNESAVRDFDSRILRIDADGTQTISLEDAFRVASCVSELDFTVDQKTESLLNSTFSSRGASDEPTTSFLRKQLVRITTGKKPSAAFRLLLNTGGLDLLLPELAEGAGVGQNRFHSFDVFHHNIYTCDAVQPPDPVLRLAGLFHDLGKVDTRRERKDGEVTFHNHEVVSAKKTDQILRRLQFHPSFIRRVKFLVRNHMFHYTDEWSDRAIRRFMKKIDPSDLEDLIQLRLADRMGSGKRQSLPGAIKRLIEHMQEVSREDARMKVRDLEIDGHDLMDLGMQPGPEMGRLLQSLLRRVVSDELTNDRGKLLEEAKEMIQNG